MLSPKNRYLTRIGNISPAVKNAIHLLDGITIASVSQNLQAYDPASIAYVDETGHVACRGAASLAAFLRTAPATLKLFAIPQYVVDLSLEGGGALGFAHFGTLHGMAARGVWCDRVAGTSAGAIAGCLIGAGYRVDLNFRTNVLDLPATPIAPSAHNSINEILFGEDFGVIPRLKTPTPSEVLASWIGQLPVSAVPALTGAINDLVADVDTTIAVASADIQAALRAAVPGIPPVLDGLIVNFIAGLLRGDVDAIAARIDATIGAVATGLLSPLLAQLLALLLCDDQTSVALRSVAPLPVRNLLRAWEKPLQGLYRLLADGAFWTGDEARDLLSRHLKAKVGGTGANGDVLFKDLPLDFACVATDVGRPGDLYDVYRTKPVIFSKSSTPLYPVAEAVRRSISLPFVFLGRTLSEGRGINPADVGSFVVKGPGVGPQISGPPGFGTIMPQAPRFDNHQHYGRVLLDGGFLFSNPAFLFRDDSEFPVYHIPRDAAGEPSKTLVISNLNAFAFAPPRPDDIPLPTAPEPIKSMLELAGPGSPSVPPPPALARLSLMLGATIAYGDLSRENEVDSAYALLPNTIFVDIGVADPASESEPNRISMLDFAGPPTTRKWKAKSGWDAFGNALAELEQQIPALRGKLTPTDYIDPYQHILSLTVTAPAAGQFTVAPRAKFGDSLFHDTQVGAFIVNAPPPGATRFLLGAEIPNPVTANTTIYVGPGATWIKLASTPANAHSNAAALVSFTANLRCRVFLLAERSAPPAFIAAQRWTNTRQVLAAGIGPMLQVFTKDFPAGAITIPGYRFGASASNSLAYSLLVAPL
ncbi:MAG: patatin-like phospholipase family protein [Gemmatimonadaceae bacterium]